MQTLNDPLREARVSVHAGRYREAATTLATLAGEARETPEWHLLSAMAAWRLGEFAESRRLALEARARFRVRGDTDGEMRAENVAAAGAFGLGELGTAEEEWARALTLARQLKDELMVARCSNNLGNISLYLGRQDAALGYYRVARAGFERLAFAHGVAETWINTAMTWRDLGRFEEAARAADHALEAAERAGSNRLVAEALSNRGEATAGLGDRAVARSQAERALALAREEGDRLAEPDVLRILANIALADGAKRQALQRGREALGAATALGHPWTVAEVQRDLGAIYLALDRPSEAARAFDAAAAAFSSLGATPRVAAMRARAANAQ